MEAPPFFNTNVWTSSKVLLYTKIFLSGKFWQLNGGPLIFLENLKETCGGCVWKRRFHNSIKNITTTKLALIQQGLTDTVTSKV